MAPKKLQPIVPLTGVKAKAKAHAKQEKKQTGAAKKAVKGKL